MTERSTSTQIDPFLLPRYKWISVIRHCENGITRQEKSTYETFPRNALLILKSQLFGSHLDRLIEACGGQDGVNKWFVEACADAWRMICEKPVTPEEKRFAVMHGKKPLTDVEARLRSHFMEKPKT